MRTTISLPDELARTARNEARRRGGSLSAVVRESLEARLRKPIVAKLPRPKLPWQGIVSDPESSARRLDESWADHISARSG